MQILKIRLLPKVWFVFWQFLATVSVTFFSFWNNFCFFFNNEIYITSLSQVFFKTIESSNLLLKINAELSISVYFITVITAKMEKKWKCEFRVMICTLLAMFRHIQLKHLPKFSPIYQKKLKLKLKVNKNSFSWKTWIRYELLFIQKKMRDAPVFANFMTQWLVTVLTHFSPVFHFYAPRKQRF